MQDQNKNKQNIHPNSPFVSNFSDLIEKIQLDIHNQEDSLFIQSDDGIFEKLLIQVLERNINSEKIKFFSIRNIVLKPEFLNLGLFTEFLNQLEQLDLNILFHDVINPRLEKFLLSKNYQVFKEIKYEETLTSLFKLNSN